MHKSKNPRVQQRPAPQPVPRMKASYTLAEQLAAVTVMVQAGGCTREAITIARQIVRGNPSESTLARWWIRHYDQVVKARPDIVPAPVDIGAIVDQTRDILLPKMKSIITKLMDKLDDDETISKATFRDVSIAWGIMIDKLENMLTLSPEELALWRRFGIACARRNMSHMEALEDYIAELERSAQQPVTSIAINAQL